MQKSLTQCKGIVVFNKILFGNVNKNLLVYEKISEARCFIR